MYASEQAADDVKLFDRVSLPKAVTEPAAELGNTEATLKGVVRPEGTTVTGCEFEYGLSAAKPGHYEHSVACEQKPATITGTEVPVSRTLSGLQAGATYHYRLSASDTEGTDTGEEVAFTLFPTAGAGSVTGVGSASATLHAQLDPGGVLTSYSSNTVRRRRMGRARRVKTRVRVLKRLGCSRASKGSSRRRIPFPAGGAERAGPTDGPDATFSTLSAAIRGFRTAGPMNLCLRLIMGMRRSRTVREPLGRIGRRLMARRWRMRRSLRRKEVTARRLRMPGSVV